MLALLDGDVIAYRSTAAATEAWNTDEEEASFDPRIAYESVDYLVRSWASKAKATRLLVCLSPTDGKTFRKRLPGDYKENRKEKPKGYWDVIQYIEDRYTTHRIDGLEADDVMGILATRPSMPRDSVIVTIDKDLWTIPARLLNPDKDKRSRKVRRAEADWNWFFQALMGDPTDGYKGCPRVGKKTAPKILGQSWDVDVLWKRTLQAFEEKGLSEEDALINVWMARILRDEDYLEDGLVKLWLPDGDRILFSL